MAGSPCGSLLLGKALMGLSLTGSLASTSVLSSVKREEESSDGESPTSPPRDILPGMGPGE